MLIFVTTKRPLPEKVCLRFQPETTIRKFYVNNSLMILSLRFQSLYSFQVRKKTPSSSAIRGDPPGPPLGWDVHPSVRSPSGGLTCTL